MRHSIALVALVISAIASSGCSSTAFADPTPSPVGGSCAPGKVCTARRFVSTDSTVSVVGHTSNFQCNANPATSSPCVANFSHPLELGGIHAATPQDDSADVYMGCMEFKDGGSCLDILNNYGSPGGGPEIQLARFMSVTGEFRNYGDITINNRASTDGRVTSVKGPLYLIADGSAGTAGPVYVWNKAGTDISEWFTGAGGTSRMVLTTDGLLKMQGGAATTVDAITTPAGYTSETDRSPFGRLPMHGNGVRVQQLGGGQHWGLEARTLTINPFFESSLCPRCTECTGTTVSAMDGQACTDDAAGGTSVVDVVDFRTFVTVATSAHFSAWNSRVAETRRNKFPHAVFTGMTTGTASRRVWYGLSSVALNGSDTPTGHIAAFRYSTAASDTTWKACTGDGATTSCSDTGVTVTASNRYRLEIDCRDSGAAKCLFTVQQRDNAPVTISKATNLPAASTNMFIRHYCETLAAAAINCGLGPSSLETY